MKVSFSTQQRIYFRYLCLHGAVVDLYTLVLLVFCMNFSSDDKRSLLACGLDRNLVWDACGSSRSDTKSLLTTEVHSQFSFHHMYIWKEVESDHNQVK